MSLIIKSFSIKKIWYLKQTGCTRVPGTLHFALTPNVCYGSCFKFQEIEVNHDYAANSYKSFAVNDLV